MEAGTKFQSLKDEGNQMNWFDLFLIWSNIQIILYSLYYRLARIKIQQAIAHHFGIETENVYLTHPTFFSKMTSAPAKTIHDEYWHPHVDKVRCIIRTQFNLLIHFFFIYCSLWIFGNKIYKYTCC